MENDTLVAVDIAKEVFEVGLSDRPGHVARRRRLARYEFLEFFAQLPQATVVMEACGSAHYWARRIEELGHVVVLPPPQYVRPYVVRNKTDRKDVEGLLEACRNERIRPVPIKSVTQQLLGIIQDPKSGLPDALKPSLGSLCEEIVSLSTRIEEIEAQLEALAKQLPVVARLRSVPGVGLLTATALYAFVGDALRFPSGRHMASFLGLTPREYSTGLHRRLGRISKRGDVYLRMLLIHGARSILWHAKRLKQPDRLRAWALRLERKLGHNKAAVALANKLARIPWAVWKNDRNFVPAPELQAA